MTDPTPPRDRFGRFVSWVRDWFGERPELDADRSALEDELNAWYSELEDSGMIPDPAQYGQAYSVDHLLELEQLQIAVIDLETGHLHRRVSVESWLEVMGL